MVYNDQPESDPRLLEAVLGAKEINHEGHEGYEGKGFSTAAILVSPEPSSDIEFDVPVWTGFYSSNTAAWFGLWLGCDPVILCGMDLYQGEIKYFHPYTIDVPCLHYPLEDHVRPWVEEGRALLPHVERLRAMSGPLGRVFGLYEPGEGEINLAVQRQGGGCEINLAIQGEDFIAELFG